MVKKIIKKDGGAVVKIDSSLLKEVEQFVNKDENKFKFVNKKQLIDLAVHEFLRQQAYPERDNLSTRGKKMESVK
jgi:hypothetical protein